MQWLAVIQDFGQILSLETSWQCVTKKDTEVSGNQGHLG